MSDFEGCVDQLAVFGTFGHLCNLCFTAHSSIRILIWSPCPILGARNVTGHYEFLFSRGPGIRIE